MNKPCPPPLFILDGSELNQHGQAALQVQASSSWPVIFHGVFLVSDAPLIEAAAIKTTTNKRILIETPPVEVGLDRAMTQSSHVSREYSDIVWCQLRAGHWLAVSSRVCMVTP